MKSFLQSVLSVVVFSLFLFLGSCSNERSSNLVSPSPEPSNMSGPVGFDSSNQYGSKGQSLQVVSSYILNLTAPSGLFYRGQRIAMTGVFSNTSGSKLVSERIGVDDGVAQLCAQVITNTVGVFTYSTTVNSSGVSRIAFTVRGKVFNYLFQTAQRSSGISRVRSIAITGLNLKNTSSRDLKVVTTLNGRTYSQKLTKNSTVRVMNVSNPNNSPRRVTYFTGVTAVAGLGLAGGDVSMTVDQSGVATASVSAGGGVFARGTMYATSTGASGVCYSPGGDLGLSPVAVSGEVSVCLGSDGLSTGGNLSALGVVSGVSISILNW